MGFGEGEVLSEIDHVAVVLEGAAVEHVAQGWRTVLRLVGVGEAREGLILLADVVVHARVPLEGVVADVAVHDVVVVGATAVGVGRWEEIDETERDGVDLAGAEGVLQRTAGERELAGGVGLVEGDGGSGLGEGGVEELGEVALPHEGCRARC